jgi:putative ABC transport system permease protein
MRSLRQMLAVTAVSVRTIPQRWSSSLVAVIGVAGVVVVLVAVLSIAEGFKAAMTAAGRPDRAIVMRSGADSEMSSGLSGPQVDIIKQAPGILHNSQQPVASGEMFVIVDLNRRATGTPANVPLRGVDQPVLAVRHDAKIIRGRMFNFGTNEVVVGESASRTFEGLEVGSTIRSGQVSWNVVGMFSTGGTVAETEIWCDVRTLQGAYNRGNSFQSVLAKLETPSALQSFSDWLSTNREVDVQIKRESDYYAEQSRTLTTLIRTIGFGIAALMALGAVFGAVLTMYAAVVSRTREIATLRALGFGTVPVLASVVGESIALALLGGVIGGALAYVGFNGYQTSTMNWQTFSQVAFAFRVTPELLVTGIVYALVMGLIGGLFPAIRAATLPIPSALREL